jgi:hypothetical protein
VPTYVVRLLADSTVRLQRLPYVAGDPASSLALELPGAVVGVFDQLIPLGDVSIPKNILLQVQLPAASIDEAIAQAVGVAEGIVSMLSCITLGAVGRPKPLWAYDTTPGVADRDYRHFAYSPVPAGIATRAASDSDLFGFLRSYFDSYSASAGFRPDWRERVERAIHAVRRGLADTDDPLTEFLILWSSIEGLDCVYRRRRPSAAVRNFMDGARDVLAAVGTGEGFERLKDLRDGLAHGNVSLAAAREVATNNIDVVRRALVVMILRVLGADPAMEARVIGLEGRKGDTDGCFELVATIRFDPGDVRQLGGHPQVEVSLDRVEVIPDGDQVSIRPTWDTTPRNLNGMSVTGYKIWGVAGVSVRVAGTAEVVVVRRGMTADGQPAGSP